MSNVFDTDCDLADNSSDTSEESHGSNYGDVTCGSNPAERHMSGAFTDSDIGAEVQFDVDADAAVHETGGVQTAAGAVSNSVGTGALTCYASQDGHEGCTVIYNEQNEDCLDPSLTNANVGDYQSRIDTETAAQAIVLQTFTDIPAPDPVLAWERYFYEDENGFLGVYRDYYDDLSRLQGLRLSKCHWHTFEAPVGLSRSLAPQLVLTTPEGQNLYLDDLRYYPGASNWAHDDDDDDF